MSFKDFLVKKHEDARKNGVAKAIRGGISEAVMGAATEYTQRFADPIWDEEWDVCLVLDATRLDLWQDVATKYDDGGSAWSIGSASPEWILRTFSDDYKDEWKDAAYVTGNPFSGKDPQSKDQRNVQWIKKPVYPLAERGLGYLDEVWRDAWMDMETVDPEVLTERGMWAYQEHSRVIVHYMQPHVPFRSKPKWFRGWGGAEDFGDVQKQKDMDPWIKLRNGQFDEDEFMEAYADNLRWVLEEVERWRTETDADILVTSDHGNAKGEWGQWSHPPGSSNPVLRRVPWCKVKGVGDEPNIDRPTNCPNVGGSTDVEDRLRHLGYK